MRRRLLLIICCAGASRIDAQWICVATGCYGWATDRRLEKHQSAGPRSGTSNDAGPRHGRGRNQHPQTLPLEVARPAEETPTRSPTRDPRETLRVVVYGAYGSAARRDVKVIAARAGVQRTDQGYRR